MGQTGVGARYEEERIQITEESRYEDEGMSEDERTMQSIAIPIHQSIRMTKDYPRKYAEGKVPMLDGSSWTSRFGSEKWREEEDEDGHKEGYSRGISHPDKRQMNRSETGGIAHGTTLQKGTLFISISLLLIKSLFLFRVELHMWAEKT